ncbi:UDP-sulfoquinovose synthase, partial [mine drainage metagenome]
LPITPYGKGGPRPGGFIALEDSMQSLLLALAHPARAGEYRVFNQFDAAYSVNQLAETVAGIAREFGLSPTIEHPRTPGSRPRSTSTSPGTTTWRRSATGAAGNSATWSGRSSGTSPGSAAGSRRSAPRCCPGPSGGPAPRPRPGRSDRVR